MTMPDPPLPTREVTPIERYVALGTMVFIVLFAAAVIWRDSPVENPDTVVFMRILLSAACGILGGIIPGFLNVGFDFSGLVVRAAGGLGFAVLTYVFTPTVLTNLETPTERTLKRAQTGDIKVALNAVNSYWDFPINRDKYQNTPMGERKALIREWFRVEPARHSDVVNVAKFLSDVHICIRERRCDPAALCASSLFDDADNYLIFFRDFLEDWARSGSNRTYLSAENFINCDCFKQLAAKRCPDHPRMCNAPANCSPIGMTKPQWSLPCLRVYA